MSPLATAQTMYETHQCDLMADIADFLARGYVVSTPERFFLFRAVQAHRVEHWLSASEQADAWWLHLGIGPRGLSGVRWFMDQLPFPLPRVLLARGMRDMRVRSYDFDRFYQLST